ncbi:MAG: adenylate/guanylate cyclase domain-containing protein [Alphaproteobacteria bacterium]|nr:adenylate/guanylate cyclase domain-containing protein [Alphaproteobacteria bacterium]
MEAPPLERKLVAIFAADVAGYSRLMGEDEEATLATLSSHRLIVDGLIAQHRGRVAGTAGDSVLAEFASVVDAVQAAIDIQKALAEANDELPESRRMQFRIGVNMGDVMVKDGDIFGDGVNIAARLEGLAEPGGICVSRGVRDHIRHRIAVGFDDLGEQSVKNIARPIRVFQLRLDGSDPEPAVANGLDQPPQADEVEIEFWDTIKHSLDPVEYRAYLERYPDGAFAPLAQARIESLEEGRQPAAAASPGVPAVDPKAIELAFWDTVKDSDNLEMFRAYLERYPEGEFAPLAQARLDDPQQARHGAASPAGGPAVNPITIELAFWDTIKESENVEMFRAYLDKYPQGEFARLAEAKLAEIEAAA